MNSKNILFNAFNNENIFAFSLLITEMRGNWTECLHSLYVILILSKLKFSPKAKSMAFEFLAFGYINHTNRRDSIDMVCVNSSQPLVIKCKLLGTE